MSEPVEATQYPLVDSEQFQALVVTGEERPAELIHELLELFHEEVEKRVAELLVAVKDEDLTTIQAQAHALAGCSSNIGGRRFSEVNRMILRACLERDLERIKDLSDGLDGHYQDTRFAILRRVAELDDSNGDSMRMNG